MDENPSPTKAVIHLANKTVLKGYLAHELCAGQNSCGLEPLPEQVEIQLLDGGTASVDLGLAKAVFFVNAFAGQPHYNELRFFKNEPEFPGLWVRVRFTDQEVTEGLVPNSLGLLIHAGFFLKPPDPQSNNRMVYALKKYLVSFEVLGLRSKY
jgi:hypothetical protein